MEAYKFKVPCSEKIADYNSIQLKQKTKILIVIPINWKMRKTKLQYKYQFLFKYIQCVMYVSSIQIHMYSISVNSFIDSTTILNISLLMLHTILDVHENTNIH